MGREWHWSSTRPSFAGDHCEEESNAHPPAGCMSGVLHYLQCHHLLFRSPSVPSSSLPLEPLSLSLPPPRIDLAGFEAPRNSLELDEGIEASFTTSAMEEEIHDVPVGIEISTPPASLLILAEEVKRSSQIVESPRSAPGIVARLMGLEILPDRASPPTPSSWEPQAQPQPRSEKNKKSFEINQGYRMRESSPSPRQPLRSLDCNTAALPRFTVIGDAGSRSLPETPRVSSSSVRSGHEYPRLSLQLSKENSSKSEVTTGDYSLPRSPLACTPTMPRKKDLGRHHDENKSPRSRHYAREIIEQVKESITCRRGGGGGDEIKFSKLSKTIRPSTEKKLSMSTDPPSPSSPIHITALSKKAGYGIRKSSALPLQPLQPPALDEEKTNKIVLNKCKKADNERFTERIRKQTQPPTTLASLFRTADMLPTEKNMIPDKNQCSSFPPIATSAVNRAGVNLEPTKQKIGHGHAWKCNDPEFRYIKTIFKRSGITGARSLRRRCSPLLPIDAIIFSELEQLEFPLFTGALRFRWNRKLMFHLVQEILGDVLLEHSSLSSAAFTGTDRVGDEGCSILSNGDALLRHVWARVEKYFPAADCRDEDDIYALIARDLPEANVRRLLRHTLVMEEADDVALEVEREILDGLVGETAADLCSVLSSFSFFHG
ncbi:hypothetical protein Cni_G24711 [Canna indica]|uniref:DUF4378 domain-containing protein n=1 Tax=Canna indica TaxID=4628 RepID=A0AAQ3QLQ5_9LILI|nr:hypothetical protein Cni_G24711 [Canna indica]